MGTEHMPSVKVSNVVANGLDEKYGISEVPTEVAKKKDKKLYEFIKDYKSESIAAEAIASGSCDYAKGLTKYTYTSTDASELSKLIPSFVFDVRANPNAKPTKNHLMAAYYKFTTNSQSCGKQFDGASLYYELPKKTKDMLIKPVNIKINFNTNKHGAIEFDYISHFQANDGGKVVSEIVRTLSKSSFLANHEEKPDTIAVFRPDTSQESLMKCIGLVDIHGAAITQNHIADFKTCVNRFITKTLQKALSKTYTSQQLTEYKQAFRDIFYTKDSKFKALVMTSQLLPNIINNLTTENVYKYVPHMSKGTFVNTFDTIMSANQYNHKSTPLGQIPHIYWSSNFKSGKPPISTWFHPFLKTTLKEDGTLIVDGGSYGSAFIGSSNMLSTTYDMPDIVYYNRSSKYKSPLDNVNWSTYDILSKPEYPKGIKEEEEHITDQSYYTLINSTKNMSVEGTGSITYNVNRSGAYCGGRFDCQCKTGDGHGADMRVDTYKFVYYDVNGNRKEYLNIGKENAPWTAEFEYGNGGRNQCNADVPSNDKNGEMSNPTYRSYTCCKHGCHNESHNRKAKNWGDMQTISRNIRSTKFPGLVASGLSRLSTYTSRRSLNTALADIHSQIISTQKGDYYFGNWLSEDECKKLKNVKSYVCSKSQPQAKWYSATFGKMMYDVYVYDDRFYYIIHKFFTTNADTLLDIFETEVLQQFYRHPELMMVYRCQQGYVKYMSSKLVEQKQTLSVNTSALMGEQESSTTVEGLTTTYMNIESPFTGALIHSDTLNILDYNDYMSNSINVEQLVDISKTHQTNEGAVVVLDSDKIQMTTLNNIDDMFANSFIKFGNVSSNNVSLPGLYISDSADPLDFIYGNKNAISFVNVDSDNVMKSVNEYARGSVLVFTFKSLQQLDTKYSDNTALNVALKNAGGEVLQAMYLPYTSLIRKPDVLSESSASIPTGVINLVFTYSTQGHNAIEVMHYNKSENVISDGTTYLSHEAMRLKGCFKFVKQWGGIFEKTNVLGRLMPNHVY